jgi:hypothetical protein
MEVDEWLVLAPGLAWGHRGFRCGETTPIIPGRLLESEQA